MIKPIELKQEVESIYKANNNLTNAEIGRMIIKSNSLDWHSESARKFVSRTLRDFRQFKDIKITTDKKVGEFDWRKATDYLKEGQKLFKNASSNQDYAKIHIDTDEPICVVVIGDLHAGSWATDYDLFLKVTEEILSTPNLYVILVGDLLQMSIKLRGVLEVSDNALPPKYQMMFLASWLNEIKHKVLASTWDNHSVMREENSVGYSNYAEIFNKHTIFHNHIGHLDVKVGDQTYYIAASHHFKGSSVENPCQSGMRYMRRDGLDREIAIAGDSHVAGMVKYTDGPKTRVVLNSGTTQTDSGYAKRFFTLTTHPVFPCIVLDPKDHIMTPYWSVAEWLKSKV